MGRRTGRRLCVRGGAARRSASVAPPRRVVSSMEVGNTVHRRPCEPKPTACIRLQPYLCAAVPVGGAVGAIARDDAVVGQVEQTRLLTQRYFGVVTSATTPLPLAHRTGPLRAGSGCSLGRLIQNMLGPDPCKLARWALVTPLLGLVVVRGGGVLLPRHRRKGRYGPGCRVGKIPIDKLGEGAILTDGCWRESALP